MGVVPGGMFEIAIKSLSIDLSEQEVIVNDIVVKLRNMGVDCLPEDVEDAIVSFAFSNSDCFTLKPIDSSGKVVLHYK